MTQEVVGDAATKGIGESEQYAWGGKGGLRRYSYTLRHTSDLDVLYLYYIYYFHYFFTAASLLRGGGHTGGSGAGRKGNAHGRKGGNTTPRSLKPAQTHCIPTHLTLAGEYFYTTPLMARPYSASHVLPLTTGGLRSGDMMIL